MAQQRRRPQAPVAPSSIPVAAPPVDVDVVDEAPAFAPTYNEPPVDSPSDGPEQASRMISTPVGVVMTKEAPQPSHSRVTPPKGLILKMDEPLRIEGIDMGQFIVVKQDTYREVLTYGAKRPTYVLLYRRGMQVLKSTLIQVAE